MDLYNHTHLSLLVSLLPTISISTNLLPGSSNPSSPCRENILFEEVLGQVELASWEKIAIQDIQGKLDRVYQVCTPVFVTDFSKGVRFQDKRENYSVQIAFVKLHQFQESFYWSVTTQQRGIVTLIPLSCM